MLSCWTAVAAQACLRACCPRVRSGRWGSRECSASASQGRSSPGQQRCSGALDAAGRACGHSPPPPISLRMLRLHLGAFTPECAVWFMLWRTFHLVAKEGTTVRVFSHHSTAAAESLSRVRLCAAPETAAHQAPPSLGSSRQERWSGCHFLLQCMKVKSLSRARWTAAHQAPPSMGFSRQEHWSGAPLPSPIITLGNTFAY